MKLRMMDLLLCPHCRKPLELSIFSEKSAECREIIKAPACRHLCQLRGGSPGSSKPDCTECFRREIAEGLLTCSCGRYYPIIGGIPRMLPDSLRDDIVKSHYLAFLDKHQDNIPTGVRNTIQEGLQETGLKKKTLESFGFQWNVFGEMFPEFRANFLNYIKPIKPSFFRGKLSLDLGCGFGRHTYYTAEFGSEVVGLDLSHAVEAAYKNTEKFPRAHIIQADIYNLPLRNDFDFLFSIGVIHHLPDPKAAFLNLSRFAKTGSSIFLWLYGREGKWFKTCFVEGTIRQITKRMPHRLLYHFCYLPAGIYQICNDIYNALKGHKSTQGLAEKIPFKGYAHFPFRVKHADAFDLLATPVNNYYTKNEIKQWFNDAGLKNIRITGIDKKSWRGFGSK